jgi:hypothetical protein
MAFSPSSRGRLTEKDLGRFAGTTLFDRLGRALCAAGCLPRKELYESWEVARRTRRLFRGGRIVDLGGGHGLLASVMLILDDSSPGAIVVDKVRPSSYMAVQTALIGEWPRLAGRITYETGAIDSIDIDHGDVVVSSHACGRLTDVVIDLAVQARASVAVLPCCHDLTACDQGQLTGWVDGPLAVDLVRAMRLRQQGYRIWTQEISKAVTPKNRLLLGQPTNST